MPQIHGYLKADGKFTNALNSVLPQSWRWVSQCLKFIVTSKLTVSVPMPQIYFTSKLTVSVPMPVPYMVYQNVKQCGRLADSTCDTRPATSLGLRGDDASM